MAQKHGTEKGTIEYQWLTFTYFEHLMLLVEPPFEIDSMDPKNDWFSVPQFGQGP